MRGTEERLSLRDAADVLGISEVTARRWVKSGKLKAHQPGRKYLIPASAVEELLEPGKAGAPPEEEMAVERRRRRVFDRQTMEEMVEEIPEGLTDAQLLRWVIEESVMRLTPDAQIQEELERLKELIQEKTHQ